MPFTLAHAAAALPFRHVRLVWSALVIGTFAPDFEYFLRLAPNDGYGHTLPGTFLLTVPVALIVLWLFHAVVKAPLVELLPDAIRNRLTDDTGGFRFGGPQRFALIVFSILVGIATHIAWDSFTHRNTWGYRNWDALHAPLGVPGIGATPVYKVFQHGSTAIGMGVLAIWLVVWFRNTKPHPEAGDRAISGRRKFIILATICSVAFLAAVTRAAIAVGFPAGHLAQERFVGLWVTTLIALLWWQAVVYGAWRMRMRKN